MEAAALARRARAVEELRRLSAAAKSTVAESDPVTPAEQECDHFSLRGYVAMLQKKDPKLCSPHIFHSDPQCHERHSSPVSVSKYHRWDCSKCHDTVKISDHRPASENVSVQQDGMNDGCTISIVRIRPRLVSWTQQSSQGIDPLIPSKKITQECNSSQGNKTITATNVPVVAEENVPEALSERSVPVAEDLQVSPDEIDMSANILNTDSKDVSDSRDDVQKIAIIEENGTQNPHCRKSCVALNEDESNIAEDVPNVDPNESNVCKPLSGHKGKQISGDKTNQVCNKGPRRTLLKRNIGSDDKKKRNKSTELPDASDPKFCQRKPKKTRLLSEIIGADDFPQMDPEGSVQRCLAKVSLDKQKIHNVSGLHKNNIPKNKKKGKQGVHEKQNVIDDFPMDIVELLARNQHERQLMTDTDTNSSENCHSQPTVAQVDCAEFAAKDCPINATNEFNTNFQKSLALERKQKSLQDHASSSAQAANMNLQDLHTQKPSQCHAASSTSTKVPNGHPPEAQMQNSLQVHALPISFNAYPSKLPVAILECTPEQQQTQHRDEEVTIACTSPIFSHHQHVAEVPAQSWRNNGEKKLMWDSFKTASRNSPTPSYDFQLGNRLQEVDSAPIHAIGASSNYAAHQPVFVAVDQPRSVPSTALTMEVGRMYDERIPGESGLYPKEPTPATHLMDSSTAPGFTNYQRADRRQMELHQTQILGACFTQHDQYNASTSKSYGRHITEEVPLTLQDLSRHQVRQNLHGPLRPRPRVGVLGSLLQQDIANLSENGGPQAGYKLGASNGTPDMNRNGNHETLNSGMFTTGWNDLQLGSAISVANPEYRLPRYGTGQPSTSGNAQTVHPLDNLVRKDICVTNRNPADFTVVSDSNEYMRGI